MSQARRANLEIGMEGADITESILPYLISLSYSDCEEDKSDSLQITLQDRDGVWQNDWLTRAIHASAADRFKMKAVISPENGFGGKLPTGDFELDSVSAQGPPSTITIKGSSLAFGSSIRNTKKTKVWKNYTLKGIAREIAQNAGLKCVYEAVTDPKFDRKEQNKKTDIAFLSELCHNAGISLKATDGRLVLFDQALYEKLPPVMVIRKNSGMYDSYTLNRSSAGTQYGSCRVSYMDPASGKCIEATAEADGDDSKSEQVLEITARVSSVAQAQDMAEKQLRLHNKYAKTASFQMPGNTALVAGVTVMLEGFGGWDGKYMVYQASHEAGNGYTTSIDLRKVNEPPEPEIADEGTDGTAEVGNRRTYTVKSGDTLWAIAKAHYGAGAMYQKIYEANKDVIGSDPNRIYPGQVLMIPE